MNIEVLHSAQQNAVWRNPKTSRLSCHVYIFPFFFCHALSLSACRRENGIKRYDITTERTVSLPTDKSTSLSTHGSHSDTQSSPQETLMEWHIAFHNSAINYTITLKTFKVLLKLYRVYARGSSKIRDFMGFMDWTHSFFRLDPW